MTITRVIRNRGAVAAAGGGFDADADFAARSSGAVYANDFDTYANDTALRASSYGGAGSLAARMTLSTDHGSTISGKACRLAIPKESDESSIAYRFSFDGLDAQTKVASLQEFYFQFQQYLPAYILDHRFKTVGGTADTSHKFAIIAEPDQSFENADCSEIVITNARFRRFVTAYRMLTAGDGGDGTGGTWTSATFSQKCSAIQEHCSAIAPAGTWDATKDLLVLAGFNSSTNLKIADLSDPSAAAVSVTQSGRPSVNSRCGWEWSDALQGIVYYFSSGDVYKITKGSGAFGSATYTWANITSGSNVHEPAWSLGSAGMNQSFRKCSWGTYGTSSYREVFLVCNNVDEPVYGFRTDDNN